MNINGEATLVALHGPLGEMFGREHLLYISSPGEAIRALCSQYKGFRETMSRPGACYSLLVGDQAIPIEAVKMESGNQDIHIVPVVEGAGGNNPGLTQVLVGAVIVAACIVSAGGFAAAYAATGFAGYAFATGSALVIGGLATMIAPAPRALSSDRPENTPSSLFSGAVNTISQNHPIQICYGELEVGSAIIASMIENSDYRKEPGERSDPGHTGGGGHNNDDDRRARGDWMEREVPNRGSVE